ncbi:hypothetical protein DHD80_02310 [Gramella sp. AN32]|nr:hypothetical protein [Gramella sp. AN32]
MKILPFLGANSRAVILNFTLIFLSTLGFAQSVTTDKDDYAPGEYVIITGSGWQAGETVSFHFDETPKPATCLLSHDLFAVADASGNISNSEFLVKQNHLGVAFVLTATGLTSGFTATAEFTDANVRVRTSGGNITVTARLNNTLNCSGSGTNSSGTATTGNDYSIAVTSTQSVQLTAPATNSLGQIFDEWTSNTTFSIPDPSNPRLICISGNVSNGSVTYTANYTTCNSPIITSQPTSQTITYGNANPVFSVIASGTSPSYQWQYRINSSTTWIAISGATSSTYTVTNPTVAMSGYQYRTVISGCNTSVTSNDAVLTINKKSIFGNFTAESKVYDGNNTAVVLSSSLSGIVSNDAVDLSGGNATFDNSNSGTNKIVTLNDSYLSGASAGNYNLVSVSTTTANITKADAVVSVTGYSGVYDGIAHGASGTAKGVQDEALNGLNLGASFTNVPGGTASWTFTDASGNYKDQSGSVAIDITKADAVVSVTGYNVVYDGLSHGASGTAKGVQNEVLSGLDLGASFANVPGGTANWTFTDVTGNYKDQSGSVAIAITKADAIVSVTGYSGIYDGLSHGATSSAKGVQNEALTGLNLGASFTNVPGGNANWSYTDATGNYKDQSGSVVIEITKADAIVSVDGYSGVYDGLSHGASGTAKGIQDEVLSGLDLGASFTNVPGGTAHWSFTDATGNYNNKSGSVVVEITKATIIATAQNFSKYCGRLNPLFTVSYSGFVNGETITVIDVQPIANSVANATSTGASYPITVSGGFDNNYQFTYVSGLLTINSITIDASASSSPVKVNTEAKLIAKVNPAVEGVLVNFSLDGILKGNALTNDEGVATLNISGLETGVYVVSAIAGGGCDRSEAYLPVYDPNGGFVTGGGWIESPAIAMSSGVTGKANFGFNAKYKTGKNNIAEVDGNTNFQFKTGNLNFSSEGHDNMSLVISGKKATYTGTGTVNGIGNHRFRVIAIDGDSDTPLSPDQFRIKIFANGSTSDVLYDNQRDAGEESDLATTILGGSIVIHKPKGSGKSAEIDLKVVSAASAEPIIIVNSLEIAPNPVLSISEVRFSLKVNSSANLQVYDYNGRLVKTLFSGNVAAYEVVQIEFSKDNLMAGIYICKLTTGDGQTYEKQIAVK